MSEKMILRFPIHPDKRAEFAGILNNALVETRAFEGCLDAECWLPENSDSDVWVYEEWETRAHQGKYFNWRVETGMMDSIEPFLAGPPEPIWLGLIK